MKKIEFHKEDFTGLIEFRFGKQPEMVAEVIADFCNAILDEKLNAEGVRVYQTGTDSEWWPNYTHGDTHTATLINIEPVKEKG